MADIIQLLPDNIANQIAAGEVIQRPASVVKELVENALDAGAKSVKVILKDAGRTLIQVVDDGKGMTETDARLAFERHATSKIRQAEDLFNLKTMGFRGEALASIASVAQVELKTRHLDAELGVHICISGSKVESQELVPCAQGSNFLVKNLFFNIPARRKFLKQNTTELRHIVQELHRVALVREDVEFVLVSNDVEMFHLPPSSRLQRISNIFGRKITSNLVAVQVDTSVVKISGFVGTLDSVKRNKEQFFFANARYMRHPYLHKAVMQAYENLIPVGSHPSYFIYFEVDTASIDVNIHPTKTEVKFEEEKHMWPILMAGVREALGKSNELPSIVFDQADSVDMPILQADTPISCPQVEVDPHFNPFESARSSFRADTRSPGAGMNRDWESLYDGFAENREHASGKDESKHEPWVATPTSTRNPQEVSEVPVFQNNGHFFQLKERYILSSVKSGLMLIDQHRAHVRILYERYIKNIDQERISSQGLLFPEVLDFGISDIGLLEACKEELASLGFELEFGDATSLTVHGLPPDLKAGTLTLVFDNILDVIKNKQGDMCTEMHKTLALITAKSSAISAGKALSHDEMAVLIDQLFACEFHAVTPDGKTVLWILGNEIIEQGFRS